MALLTYKSALMYKDTSASAFSKLIDIVDYPALEDPREGVDCTTMSDGFFKEIPGLGSGGRKDFRVNYNLTDFLAIKAMEGSLYDVALWFGGTVSNGTFTPDGSDGKQSFQAYISVSMDGGEVNGVRQMIVSVYRQNEITYE